MAEKIKSKEKDTSTLDRLIGVLKYKMDLADKPGDMEGSVMEEPKSPDGIEAAMSELLGREYKSGEEISKENLVSDLAQTAMLIAGAITPVGAAGKVASKILPKGMKAAQKRLVPPPKSLGKDAVVIKFSGARK